jgi:hypothetical protein
MLVIVSTVECGAPLFTIRPSRPCDDANPDVCEFIGLLRRDVRY